MIRRSRVIRTVLLIGALFMAPMGTITLAPVSAGALSFPTITCSVGGTMSFGSLARTFVRPFVTLVPGDGISKDGWATTGDGGAQISYPTLGGAGCSGTGTVGFADQRLHCDRRTPGVPTSNPACEPRQWGFNSWADLLGDVSAPLGRNTKPGASYAQAIQHGFGSHGGHSWYFVINGTAFAARSTSVYLIPAGNVCGPSEIGFGSIASIFSPRPNAQTMTVNLCLGAITGTGLNPGDNFYNASVDQIGVVETAVIDPATSTVHIA